MANERRQIATDHQTERAQEFGLRRDHEIASVSYTRLNRPGYTHYGKEAIVYLNKILAQMEYSKQDFLQKKHFFIDSALGRSSLVEITILDKEDLEKQGWFTTPLDQKVPKWFPKELWYTQRRSVDQHKEFYLALKRFWEEDLQEYEWLEKENHIRLFYSVVPPHHNKLKLIKTHAPVRWIDQFLSPKTLLVELTVSFEINGKLRPLYGYFTALYRDEDSSSEDLLKRMESHSPPLLIHQRQFLIEETLNDAASVFGQIVRWKGDDLNELKQLMALFRFQMSCMPFYRGSSAITEWLEAALYNYHRVSYKFDPSRQIDLEVYSHPLFSDFIKAYDSICTLSLKE